MRGGALSRGSATHDDKGRWSLAEVLSSAGDRAVTVSEGGDREVHVRISGTWLMRDGVSLPADVTRWLSGRRVSRVRVDGSAVARWDSALVTFVHELAGRLARQGVAADLTGLPEGARKLLTLAGVSPDPSAIAAEAEPRLARLGDAARARGRRAWSDPALLGEVARATGRLLTGRAHTRAVDVVEEMVNAGARALPIVTVTSALLGAIMAFVGAAALRPFGASVYVANVVAIATLRELGAVLTAIVMAGRTGSSYAAQLATMRLTEELDALETMAVPAVEFLVLPRVLALSLMQPLLCVYADFVGVGGGALVACGMLDLTPGRYFHQTKAAVSLTTFSVGVGKSFVFGVLVAFLGCRAGLRTGRSASAVGQAATTAMVSAIVAIIVADGAFAVILQTLGI
jgi:phospholipid/cholesterol/gamma-HCH transport system permease protein